MNHVKPKFRRGTFTKLVVGGALLTTLTLLANRGRANAPTGRYVVSAVNNVSVVTDAQTGLVWQRAVAPCVLPWSDAQAYCGSLGAGWRLPSVEEMETIVDDTTFNPAIDASAFPNTPVASYWTLSPLADHSSSASYVDFRYGFSFYGDVSLMYRARCVR